MLIVQRNAELAILRSLICGDSTRPVEAVEHVVGFVQVQPDRLSATRAGNTGLLKSVPFTGLGQPKRSQVSVIGSRLQVDDI